MSWKDDPASKELLARTASQTGVALKDVEQSIQSVFTSCESGMKASFHKIRVWKFGTFMHIKKRRKRRKVEEEK